MRWRTGIFVYDLVVLAALIVFGIIYLQTDHFSALCPRDAPSCIAQKYELFIKCMWLGALGGLMISLKGVYDHGSASSPWDDAYNLWHIGRPVSGAVTGLMTVLLLLAINPSGQLTRPIVYAIAFIFGTQERRFFNFLYEVAALVVRVPSETEAVGIRVKEVSPAHGHAGQGVTVRGQGLQGNPTVKFGSFVVANPSVSADGTTITGNVPDPGAIPPAGLTVDVLVVNANGSAAALLNGFRFT